MAEKLTTLAKRLRPFILGQVAAAAGAGGVMTEGPGIDLLGSAIGFGGDSILLYHVSGNPVTEYALTAAGLTAGLGVITSGEWLRINGACSLTGNFTLPAGCELKADSLDQVTIIGTVTLNDDSRITNLKIANVANDANVLYGVVGPQTGTAYILNCDISAIQSGAGNAYALGATRGLTINVGNIDVQYSKLYGSSVGGSGYDGRSTAGFIYSRHNRYSAGTARWVLS